MSSQENFEAYICGIDSNEFTEESSSVLCPISSQSYCPESCVKEELEITDDEDESLPSNYLNKNLFRLLIPALEETLIEASKWKALRVQKCRFNGVDHIAQILWNQNPRRSKVYSPPLDVFEIPVFKEYLRLHPRPNYPKSWLWTDEEAALHIQRYVRGWLVRKQAEVQEMRQFWKEIAGRVFEKGTCIVQPQRVSVKPQDVPIAQEVTDEDLLRCKKYREIIYASKKKET